MIQQFMPESTSNTSSSTGISCYLGFDFGELRIGCLLYTSDAADE